jgi:uncharacterized protein
VHLAEALAIFTAGGAAGAVNAVVGSGSLITFPTLLAFGFPPVVANVSNNIGLVPGNVSGAVGYRRELAGQRGRLLRLGTFAAAGSLAGAAALLLLPSSAFEVIVPVLILVACVLVLVQPWLGARISARRGRAAGPAATPAPEQQARGQPAPGQREPEQPAPEQPAPEQPAPEQPAPGRPAPEQPAGARPGSARPDSARPDRERLDLVLGAGVFGSSAYGGYFGAAQGVLLIGLLGTFLDEPLQRVNGAKNVLVGIANGTAAVVYMIFAHVSWLAVLLIAVGSTVGGMIGARYGRRLPPLALRIFIVVIGVVAAVKLIFF